jgi:Asp-tRNA(Asn)/Glu-tRNA(Gln) amidotransferase A subunit family amidase
MVLSASLFKESKADDTFKASSLRAVARASSVNSELRAFIEIFPSPPPCDSGPLHGLPYAAKDLADLAGRAPTLGLATAPYPVPNKTAVVIEMLAQQGACLIGFTNMTPLAYEPSGGNSEFGRPVNPWSAKHICGGSSSGSAVAVAAGIVSIALGSDTAGSVRIPAHCCGITAWKPTKGAIPADGTMALAPSLDIIGFLARAAIDILPIEAVFTTAAGNGVQPIRKVVVARDVISDCDPDIASVVRQFESALRVAGIEISDTHLNGLILACDRPVLTLLQGEITLAHGRLLASAKLDPVLRTRLSKGLTINSAQLQKAQADLAALAEGQLAGLFADADAVLLPVMRISTPTIDLCEPGSTVFSPRVLYELSALTRWINGFGLPAISVPAGFDSRGLPVGVQIIARANWDRALIELAATLQDITDWHFRVPTELSGLGTKW